MTPLAYQIVNDMTLPKRKRAFRDDGGLTKQFREEVHCFEVTQIMKPLVEDLLLEMLDAEFPTIEFAFLPATRTWLEYKDIEGGRVGAMLLSAGEWARVYLAGSRADGGSFTGGLLGEIALSDALRKIDPSLGWRNIEASIFRNIQRRPDSDIVALQLFWKLYPLLLLINTPRVVGRKTHDPHRGLAREILSKGKTLGIFPLQAWTEITLTTETIDAGADDPEPSGLTGTMPLHWTRAHKRRVRGVWTLISDYWSGDGSLGIKRSRYKVVP